MTFLLRTTKDQITYNSTMGSHVIISPRCVVVASQSKLRTAKKSKARYFYCSQCHAACCCSQRKEEENFAWHNSFLHPSTNVSLIFQEVPLLLLLYLISSCFSPSCPVSLINSHIQDVSKISFHARKRAAWVVSYQPSRRRRMNSYT